VKTALIEGIQPAEFDASLLRTAELILDTPERVWSESLLIGIRNEYGDTYRVIGVTGLTELVDLLEKLHGLGCMRERPNCAETEQDFDAVFSPP
jgi:hypothetical protein